ncbi:hypothetical protein KC332_g13365 [Hortaea werneckii]|nr:hypothetical protein KC358_g13345 [Hortaea werneckii]KAI6809246.1 hypothetical protein KC350_g13008 [Hortaea werneckii]KAI6909937.1 hypothetical protein KC348_g13368 [Hortaea werneckii]KAI6925996.1 hypothetical protein KC341_g13045 [Hortaea werneckii]KAI6959788.1 hypothetical protein KC321_g13219 [Hortaea werneckii]
MATAPFTLALGEADLMSTHTDLHAHLFSSIQLAPTENHISPDDSDVLMKALRNDDDRCKRPWIHRANSFRIELSIGVAENTLTLINEGLIERLASSFQEAELWRQLSLVVTSVETFTESGKNAHVITMTVRNNELDIDPSRRCRHKLATGAPRNDVKSPKGLHSYALEAVQLSMHVEHEELLQAEADDALLPYHALIATDESVNSQMSHKSSEYTLFDEDWATGSLPLFPERCIEPVRRPRTCGPTEQDAIDFQTNEALRLFDVAFRAAIAEQPRRFGHGIKIKNANKLKRLADVAPSTWSPGYSSDISSRAVILPTISHALANVVSRSNSMHGTETPPAGDGEGSTVPQPSCRLEMKLWNLLRGAMYDEESAQHLRPLHFDEFAEADKEIEMVRSPEPPPIYEEFEDTDGEVSFDQVLEKDQMGVDNGSQEPYGYMDPDEDWDEDWCCIQELFETSARDRSEVGTPSLFQQGQEDRSLEQDLIL